MSWCPECGPSPGWLGLHSPERKVRESGLWLAQKLDKQPLSEGELGELSALIEAGICPKRR